MPVPSSRFALLLPLCLFLVAFVLPRGASAQTAPPAVAAEPPEAYAYTPPPRVPNVTLGPSRRGLTVELGVGLSHTTFDSAPTYAATAPIGLAPINLGVGGFVSRDLALSFRATGTSTFRDRGFGIEQTVLAFYGLSAQVFLTDRVFVSGGLGLGMLFNNPYMPAAERAGAPATFGIAATGRVGWNVHLDREWGLSLYAEATPVHVDGTNALGGAFGLNVQFY